MAHPLLPRWLLAAPAQRLYPGPGAGVRGEEAKPGHDESPVFVRDVTAHKLQGADLAPARLFRKVRTPSALWVATDPFALPSQASKPYYDSAGLDGAGRWVTE